MDTSTDTVAARLRAVRSAKNLTMKDVERDTGIDDSLISLLERGRRKITRRTVVLYASIYGINEEWLLTGTGEMFVTREPEEKQQEEDKYQNVIDIFDSLPEHLQKTVLDFCADLLSKRKPQFGDIPAPASLPLSDVSTEDEIADSPPTLPIDQKVRRVAGSEPKLR